MDKEELRKRIKALKRQYSSKQLEVLSLDVLQRLWLCPHFQKAKTVLMYYSLPDEVDTHQAIKTLLAEKRKVLLPVVTSSTDMELRDFSGEQDLVPGKYGIMEPKGKLFPESEYAHIDLAVIPGMSFDKVGHRLGRGKGYYDRFLKKASRIYKIGICFDFQKVEHIPTESFDIQMDEVI